MKASLPFDCLSDAIGAVSRLRAENGIDDNRPPRYIAPFLSLLYEG